LPFCFQSDGRFWLSLDVMAAFVESKSKKMKKGKWQMKNRK
jgi:hypothetical protein